MTHETSPHTLTNLTSRVTPVLSAGPSEVVEGEAVIDGLIGSPRWGTVKSFGGPAVSYGRGVGLVETPRPAETPGIPADPAVRAGLRAAVTTGVHCGVHWGVIGRPMTPGAPVRDIETGPAEPEAGAGAGEAVTVTHGVPRAHHQADVGGQQPGGGPLGA